MYFKKMGALVLACLISSSAIALPGIKVSYLQQTGTAHPDERIPLWVKVSSDREIDTSLGAPFGFDISDLPKSTLVYSNSTLRTVDFAEYSSISIAAAYTCTDGCTPQGYSFQDYYGVSEGRSFWNLSGNKLITGEFLVGWFVPDGTVKEGTSRFNLTPTLAFNVYGYSASKEAISEYLGPANGFEACSYKMQSICGFSRAITAVPEPNSIRFYILGLIFVVAYHYKKKSKLSMASL